jgi:hypothetical protein
MKNRSTNLFTNDWPNRFYKARMRNVRWVRNMERLDSVSEQTINQVQETNYGGSTGNDQQTIEDIEARLNS